MKEKGIVFNINSVYTLKSIISIKSVLKSNI